MKNEEILIFREDEINSQVLERLDGLEDMIEADMSISKKSLYSVNKLKNWDWDDTNESVKYMIDNLLEECKNVDFFIILGDII